MNHSSVEAIRASRCDSRRARVYAGYLRPAIISHLWGNGAQRLLLELMLTFATGRVRAHDGPSRQWTATTLDAPFRTLEDIGHRVDECPDVPSHGPGISPNRLRRLA